MRPPLVFGRRNRVAEQFAPIELKSLHGKFVLLDFWTYRCINRMHVLPELHKLEKVYPNNIVVIGVHSGKVRCRARFGNIPARGYGVVLHLYIRVANHVTIKFGRGTTMALDKAGRAGPLSKTNRNE